MGAASSRRDSATSFGLRLVVSLCSVPGEGRRGPNERIPEPTVARLPLYHRALSVMVERGIGYVSSSELASIVGVNPATLRRDLSRFGTYGTRGTGYEVPRLLARVDGALALDHDWPLAMVGIGNLGRALVRSRGFRTGGFRVAVLADVDSAIVGTMLEGIVIEHLDRLGEACAREKVRIGVIATPASASQSVAELLVTAGVRSILNFAPVVLSVPEKVTVRQVDLAAELQVLAFYRARPPGRDVGAGEAVGADPAADGGVGGLWKSS
ncbi:MAG TPA: redox-sensing transcriptional repressor Rex [Acidimicrobiales bacterium]|nr:redox-sensing transcriptional repressor Rex [Acidimicrobiales bacterium]